MATFKHLTLDNRYTIEHSLNNCFSFKAIGRILGKDCTTISKEIRNHCIFKKTGSYGRPFNNCIHSSKCDVHQLCPVCTNKSYRSCKFCRSCTSNCADYKAILCKRLSKPPYVCNGCSKLRHCTLKKSFYKAIEAHNEYVAVRSKSRVGISINETEAAHLDQVISPLIKQGQSIHHICTNNSDRIMCSEKTIYNYVGYNLFSARIIDLPRKIRYRPRKNKHLRFKVDKACRIGRTYTDYLNFLSINPDTPVVQMDSVEGIKGGKVLLTIHFVESEMMLAFIRDTNDSQSVVDIFDDLYLKLGSNGFGQLSPLLLGDNGSEFSHPLALELDPQKNTPTHVFFCDPSAPYQKGAAENNHEFIRRILPKGTSFNSLNQADINHMMNPINSYGRRTLGDRTPYEVFKFIKGSGFLEKLGCKTIAPNDIVLLPNLLKK